jgi:plasmid stabilization system protein ParE
MTIRFLLIAQRELDDAYLWYEKQSPDLGIEFLDEIDRAIHRIKAYPLSCAEFSAGVRRVLVKRFPYGLIYGLDGETIVIIAVAHLHREPYYWMNRPR